MIYGAYYGASGGLYADGYFDRQTITYSEVNNGSTNIDCPTVGSGDSLAYAGILCYNTNTYASNFFPFGGRIPNNATYLDIAGVQGFYWTTTIGVDGTSSIPYFFNPVYSVNTTSEIATVNIWIPRADACTIRPVADMSSTTTIDASLDGFTDENGWE